MTRGTRRGARRRPIEASVSRLLRHSRYSTPMKLLLLHGAPAAGKLTVAKALLGMVPGRLFDNHVAIDLALTIFDFGAPGFWELVHSVRCAGDRRRRGARRSACRHHLLLCRAGRPAAIRQISKRSCNGAAANCCRCSCTAPGRGRAQGRQSRPRRTAQADVGGNPDEGFRHLRFRAGAAGRLPEARYRGEAGGGDRAGNHRAFWTQQRNAAYASKTG